MLPMYDSHRLLFRVIGPFNASEDLPIDYEDALLVWMNKVAVAYFKSPAVTKYRDTKQATSVS